jgi:anti-sigma B factor antagonist
VSIHLTGEIVRDGFEAAVDDRVGEGDAIAINLRGEIDARAEAALLQAYTQVAARASCRIVLDFAGVDYINSTGIALIVGFLASARKDSREVVARGLSPHYREIFEITRLADFMKILPEESPTGSASDREREGGD